MNVFLKELNTFNDEVIIDIWSALGAYCGSFVIPKKYVKQFIKRNLSDSSRYFEIRTKKSIKQLAGIIIRNTSEIS